MVVRYSDGTKVTTTVILVSSTLVTDPTDNHPGLMTDSSSLIVILNVRVSNLMLSPSSSVISSVKVYSSLSFTTSIGDNADIIGIWLTIKSLSI